MPENTTRQRSTTSGGEAEDERFEAFARNIAHELKNPLGAARGAAEMLASGEGLDSDEDRTRFAELVLRNINRALDLLEDVRAMAQDAARPGAGNADSADEKR